MKDTWQLARSGKWIEIDPQQVQIPVFDDGEIIMVYNTGDCDVLKPYVTVCSAYPCRHPFISWHGDRPECQDCGEIVPESLSFSGDTMPDLPIHGWLWYDESDQIDTSTKENPS